MALILALGYHGEAMRRPLLTLTPLLVLACPAPAGDEDTSDDASGTSDTATSTSDSTDSTDSTDADTTVITTAAGSCEIEFEGPAPGTFSPLFIRNDRAVPIYIPFTISDCTWEPFAVFDGEVQYYWYDDAYVPTCNNLFADDCIWGCSDGPTHTLRLEPGAQWETSWGLYVWQPVVLDEACTIGSGCSAGTTCWAGREWVEDGPLTARLRVSESCGTDTCDCGGAACLLDLDSLSAAGWPATDVVDVEFDAGFVGDITIAVP